MLKFAICLRAKNGNVIAAKHVAWLNAKICNDFRVEKISWGLSAKICHGFGVKIRHRV